MRKTQKFQNHVVSKQSYRQTKNLINAYIGISVSITEVIIKSIINR